MASIVEDRVKRATKLEQDRSQWRNNMAIIAELIRPLRNELRQGLVPQGERRDRGVYTSVGINANQNLAAGLFGTFCNPSDKWFAYGPLDEELNSSIAVQRWCEAQTMYSLRSATPTFSAFYSQMPTCLLDGSAFGNAVFSSEEKRDENGQVIGFRDVCRPLSECVWDVDSEGDVNTMFRRWKMPAHAAIRRFKNGLSRNTLNRAANEPDYAVEIMHSVMPADTSMAREGLKTNLPFVSVYDEVEEKHQISTDGFYEFPYHVWRWEVAAGEKMGRGPGEIALADVQTANVATRDNIKAGNRAADPPWGAPDEGSINNIRVAPGKVTYGAVNQQGKQLLLPLINGSQLPWSIEMQQRLEQAVKDAFYFSVLQLVGRTGMTATEVLEIREERMRLLAPYGARLQNDLLAPWALRRFNMRKRLGLVSPAPPELANRSIQVAFTSPFSMAQKSAAANSTLRTLVAVKEIATFDPEIVDRVDGDAALRAIREGFGAPASLLRTDDDTEARRKIRRQAQSAALTAEVADKGAGAFAKGATGVAKLREQQQAA